MQLEAIWETAASDLKALGVGVYEMNYQFSRNLNRELNVNYYPQFIAVIAGKIVKYSADEFSRDSLRTFVRSVLPRKLVKQVRFLPFNLACTESANNPTNRHDFPSNVTLCEKVPPC